jgi:hypothetical protein
MRRLFSISLTLLLWLGPLASLLPGADESRLPFCCRRHGAHHCAMDAAPAQGSGVALKALSRCAQFPAALAVTTAPAFGLTAPLKGLSAVAISKYSPRSRRDDARAVQIEACTGRGPPTSPLA